MAATLWSYVITAAGTARRISQKQAECLYRDDVASDVPEREPGGVLLADVLVKLESRVPVEVTWIYLTPVLKNPVGPKIPTKRIGLDIVEGLRAAVRRDLRRAGASELTRLEQAAMDNLGERIRKGIFAQATYQDRDAHGREAVNSVFW
jgi:hypothetical protein